MRSGNALDDDDRRPWLDALALAIRDRAERAEDVVLACSALKRRYRATLATAVPEITFVYLKAIPDVIRGRLEARHSHFMPSSLIASQFSDLEEPAAEESAIVLDTGDDLGIVLETLIARVLERKSTRYRPDEQGAK